MKPCVKVQRSKYECTEAKSSDQCVNLFQQAEGGTAGKQNRSGCVYSKLYLDHLPPLIIYNWHFQFEGKHTQDLPSLLDSEDLKVYLHTTLHLNLFTLEGNKIKEEAYAPTNQ